MYKASVTKHIILFIGIVILCFIVVLKPCIAQQSYLDSLNCRLSISYTQQNIGSWQLFIDELDERIKHSPSDSLYFQRLLLRHIYIAHLLFQNSKNADIITQQLSGMKSDMTTLEQLHAFEAERSAFNSSYAAYSALNKPFTALYYLPKSFWYAKDAVEKFPHSAYCWTEYGNLQYSYALFIGGSFADAINSYKKALRIMEKSKQVHACNWYYIHTLLFLAKSYEDNKQLREANAVYDSILKIAPNFEAIHRWKHK